MVKYAANGLLLFCFLFFYSTLLKFQIQAKEAQKAHHRADHFPVVGHQR